MTTGPGAAGSPWNRQFAGHAWAGRRAGTSRRYVQTLQTCQNDRVMADVATCPPGPLTLGVPMGRRVGVLANLLLSREPTSATVWAATSLARVLDDWDGPGTVVVAGNLLDLRPGADHRMPDERSRGVDTSPSAGSLDGARSPDDHRCPDGQQRASTTGQMTEQALAAHEQLRGAIRRFIAREGRTMVCLPGHADVLLATCPKSREVLSELGIEVASTATLVLESASGTRAVLVTADATAEPAPAPTSAPDLLPAGRLPATTPGPPELATTLARRAPAPAPAPAAAPEPAPAPPEPGLPLPGRSRRRPSGGDAPWAGLLAPDPDAPWQEGLDRLADPAGARRFVTSRLLYRRLARFAWWLLVPYAVVLLLREPGAGAVLSHLLHGRLVSHHALLRAQKAGWETRLAAATGIAVVGLLAFAGVLGIIGRKAWAALGGGDLGPPWRSTATCAAASANDEARDTARTLVATGWAGMVTGATPQAELSHLGTGFFASTGATGVVVDEHPGRLGLPPVFLPHRQLSWVELETGAQLHARLLLARGDEPGASLLERLAARCPPTASTLPSVVASYPQGGSWPLAPDLQVLRRRSRRVRRWAATALALAGAVDIVSATIPPLRDRLRLVLHVLPVGVPQAAGPLVVLAGIGLVALARGVRRGQHRAWLVSVGLLGATAVLHALRGGDLTALVVGIAVLVLLVTQRHEFQAASDGASMRSALYAIVGGGLLTTVVATTVVELSVHVDRDSSRTVPFGRAVEAVVERLWGITTVPLPARLDGFLTPSLLAVGMALVVAAVLLATRPVVLRARGSGKVAELRARDIVRRHGQGTLDYFALRSDKEWFFHRDSLVAYGLYGGICLVSPDPIGPAAERHQVWAAFRRFAETHGWVVAVMGASEQWLATYRASGMHDIYIGDEAVVDVTRFSLAGGRMKGLRQAYNRIARYGYTARFCDPAHLDPAEAARLTGLLDQSRHGQRERGFSMMLGRIFDRRDDGLLLCVVDDPDGEPAAMCQFVPAQGIGGYSLDLMRRSRGAHPNGLVDFALISTIEHVRQHGGRGLSLNFAALRSVLDGGRGDSVPIRVERWALERMSSILQIETLWRFNAKYEPDWLPRYVVYDAAEHLVPAAVAIVRAESLWDVPVLGRLVAAAERRSRSEPADLPPPGPPVADEPHSVAANRGPDPH